MPVRRTIAATEGIYFITFTCTNWIPLFTLCNAYDAVYKWFDYLKSQKHYIIGYVIMPNHVHAVVAFSNGGKRINTIVGNGKSWQWQGSDGQCVETTSTTAVSTATLEYYNV